ncbi:DUF6894 family protein [Mesorhizobium captivum]|uniref:DUF6894 family protein n=1 Tax=Mesorhizobium captivum TaxID=3072319 RepID=UPI003D310B13
MPRFFFDLADTGDVYHDARGAMLLGTESAKERALEMVRKLVAGPPPHQISRSGLHSTRHDRQPDHADQN